MEAVMNDLEARLRNVEARLRAAEDRLEIYRIMSSYGPAVDSGEGQTAARLWSEDGVYDAQVGTWTGRDAIAGMVAGPAHQGYISEGCAHVIGMPLVNINRDAATATCYARLYRREGDGFRVWRVTANRWEFVRGKEGWEVKHRVNRLLDGSEEARAVLRQAVVTKDVAAES
jgi:hypothetical protein